MTDSFDVIVIGAGTVGSAACDAIARRGARCLALEQFDVGHELGSSGGRTRLIRRAYFEHPDYVPLLEHAYAGWDALAADAETEILARTGLFYAGAEDGALLAGSRRAASLHGIPLHTVDASELGARFPQFRIPDDCIAMFEPDAGFVFVERGIRSFVERARRHGATVREGETVERWDSVDGGFEVTTNRGAYRSTRLVVCAGAWSGRVLRDLGVDLRVTRQVVAWVEPSEDAKAFARGAFPCWAIQDPAPDFEGLYYGFPRLEGDAGIKTGHHRRGPTVDPRSVDRTGTPDDVASLWPGLERYVPGAVGSVQSYSVCMYTYSPDQHFILGPHPSIRGLSIACGLSGHGFKFAPVLGQALADYALEERTELPAEFLAPSRFA